MIKRLKRKVKNIIFREKKAADINLHFAYPANQYKEVKEFLGNKASQLKECRWKKYLDITNHKYLKKELKNILCIPKSDSFLISRTKSHIITHSISNQSGELNNIEIQLDNGITIRGILGVPEKAVKGNERLPAVICLHGYRSLPEIIFGLNKSKEIEGINRSYENNFALELMRNGYIVFAPYIINDFHSPGKVRRDLDMLSIPLGHRLAGIELMKIIRSIDFLGEHNTVDPDRIGIYGISTGGNYALWSAAIDSRIKVTVLSNSFGGSDECLVGRQEKKPRPFYLSDQTWAMHFNYLDKFDDYILAFMVLPRPLFIEVGEDDYKCRITSQYVKSIAGRIDETDFSNHFGYEIAGGKGHEIVFNQSREFISQFL